jgi:D-arginine utilization repressor
MTEGWARAWGPVGLAMARLLGPQAEVVLHDARTDRILAIWQPMSGRVPGDPSYLGELDRLAANESGVYGPYEKLLPDGRRLSCVSAVITAADDTPELVLCVNLDRSPFDQAAELLAAFAAPVRDRPAALFEQDWAERINQVIGGHVRSRGRRVEQFDRADRVAVLAELDQHGVFAVRRSASQVAGALRVSRSTVYALLAQIRTEGVES